LPSPNAPHRRSAVRPLLELFPVLSYEPARVDRCDLPGDARVISHAFPLVDGIVTRCSHWNQVGARVLPAKLCSASRRATGVRFSANEICAIVAKPSFAVHASEGSAFFDECARSIRGESEKPTRLWNEAGGYGPHMIVVGNMCTKRLNVQSRPRRHMRHERNERACGDEGSTNGLMQLISFHQRGLNQDRRNERHRFPLIPESGVHRYATPCKGVALVAFPLIAGLRDRFQLNFELIVERFERWRQAHLISFRGQWLPG
jgi:hypothetical protein